MLVTVLTLLTKLRVYSTVHYLLYAPPPPPPIGRQRTVNFRNQRLWRHLAADYKQLLDEVFVISGIIKVEVSVISRSRRLRLITLTETLIISDITKTESNNCFIIHCFKANNDKRVITANVHSLFSIRHVRTSLSVNLTLLLEIMHCARNLQIIL